MPGNSQKPKCPPIVTLQDRLEHGNLTVAELLALAHRSKTAFYADVKAGVVKTRKRGRRTEIPGPSARRYIAGEQAE